MNFYSICLEPNEFLICFLSFMTASSFCISFTPLPGITAHRAICEFYHFDFCILKNAIVYRPLGLLFWSLVLDEELPCSPERDNPHDIYAINLLKNKTTVGHVQKEEMV